MSQPYRVPVGSWSDRAAFILGGGPSLASVDVARLHGRGGVIAINDAGLYLAPWADYLYFADGMTRWGNWNLCRLHLFTGGVKLTRSNMPGGHGIERVRYASRAALSRAPDALAGVCSGTNALNLAFLLGAPVVVLLGIDLHGPGNWHANHQLPTRPENHGEILCSFEAMAAELAREDCLVLNANPESALRAFPFCDLDALLAMPDIVTGARAAYGKEPACSPT